ncbi:hypothetical protein DK26_08460 [Bosea sp. WAO]|nr:hypothetical protein DK26_08460 [Bosea sp. WAO]
MWMLCAATPDMAFAGEPRFRITLHWSGTEVSPLRQTFRTYFEVNFALIGGRGVEERVTNDPSPLTPRWSPNRTKTLAFGEEYAVGRFPAVWRVLDDRTLIRIVAYPTHSWIVRVSTNGTSSCSVKFEWRLKDGLSEFGGWSNQRKVETRWVDPVVRASQCEVLRQT